ncbi:MAG: hypothetical protein ING10_05710 [Roseomonas sp.]|nr:hypothetical protein [Roseomonas sp.]
MDNLTIEAEAKDLIAAGASSDQIDEMESALRFCVEGMSFVNGAWSISPPVARVLRDTPPGDALPRFLRGIEVLETARRLVA